MATEEEKMVLTLYSARVGCQLTDEQIEFASDFTKPVLSFSDPGTGKTFSLIAGLITAQTLHKVPGPEINVMSFTRAATAEISNRYKEACKKCLMTPTVQFNTFHATCLNLIKEAYPNLKIKNKRDLETDLKLLGCYMEAAGIPNTDYAYRKSVLSAINTLNSSLAFDTENIRQYIEFCKLEISVEEFQEIRKSWLLYGLTAMEIDKGDIPIYALYVLCSRQDIQIRYKNLHRIMVVDEFQDLSLLHLEILSLISKSLVAIGDIKQQIYAFNGASQQIVEEFRKLYPGAKEVSLTKSFRCKNNIADFATRLIRRNNRSIIAFKGESEGGEVSIVDSNHLDLSKIIETVRHEEEERDRDKKKNTMFLFRNNVSAIPIAEALYKSRVAFRMPKLQIIPELPIFGDICKLVDAAIAPGEYNLVYEALSLLPEFKKYSFYENPVVNVMRQTGTTLFDVPYRFSDTATLKAVNRMQDAAVAVMAKKSAGQVFNILWDVYCTSIIQGKWWLLPNTKEYYCRLIAAIVNTKDYATMINEELDKKKFNIDCINAGYGVRCYTVHSAKGLEADTVYLLDADNYIFPNKKKIDELVANECILAAAKEIRNERNLLYVAVTRAKERVVISYNDDLTALVGSPEDNEFDSLDSFYESTKKVYDDVQAFRILYGIA